MSKVQLKDGSIVEIDIDPSWGNDEVQRAIREYKANPDPSETDSWPTYLGKEALSIGREGVAGLASTADTLTNLMPGVGLPTKIAGRVMSGKPLDWDVLNPFSGDQPTRDLYEKNVPKGPRGSDYETTGKVAEVLVPAVAETLLTGSPKTAPLRAARDITLGVGGGVVGEKAAEQLGGEKYGELGRMLGSVLTPGVASPRMLARGAASLLTNGLSLGTRALGKLDPFKLIPPSTAADAAKRALVGGTASNVFDYEEKP